LPQVRESLLDEVSTGDVKASFLQRVCAALYEPVDISFLVFFRIVFGIMLWEVSRGCGENFYYDGLNRVIGKDDYSPCLTTQPAYTPAQPATGSGFEVTYQYDTYEAGQVSPEPGFVDDAKWAIGKLVAVRDRGSHTRFNYDAHERVRRTSRQLGTPASTGADFLRHTLV
jgi:YD repeat-containing protein